MEIHYKNLVSHNITSNIINKGELKDSFGYGGEITFQKKGSEIKSQLQNVLLQKNLRKAALAAKLMDLRTMIPHTPDQLFDDRRYDDKKENILSLCPMLDSVYSYDATVLREDMASNYVPSTTPTEDLKNISNMCSAYNDLVYACMDTCKEICLAATLMDNFEDGKTYTLNVNQLQALGF